MDRIQIKSPHLIYLFALIMQGFILCTGVGYLYKNKKDWRQFLNT